MRAPRPGQPIDQQRQAAAVGALHIRQVDLDRARAAREGPQPLAAQVHDRGHGHGALEPIAPGARLADARGAGLGHLRLATLLPLAAWLSSRWITASRPFWSISAPKSSRKLLT